MALATIIMHDSLAAGRASSRVGVSIDRIGPAIVKIGCRVLVQVRDFSPTERVLTLCLHVEKLRSATLTRGVLVCHTWLHDPLQAFALAVQLVDCVVLLLQSILQILYHALFDLLKVFDVCLVCRARSRMLIGCLNVRLRDLLVVGLPVKLVVRARLHLH